MIAIKNERELALMRQACKITAAARALAGEMVRPGVSTKAIDKAVNEFILKQGAKPSFLHYNGFPASTCISVNATVIHGIPGGYVLQDGDIVSFGDSLEWSFYSHRLKETINVEIDPKEKLARYFDSKHNLRMEVNIWSSCHLFQETGRIDLMLYFDDVRNSLLPK